MCIFQTQIVLGQPWSLLPSALRCTTCVLSTLQNLLYLARIFGMLWLFLFVNFIIIRKVKRVRNYYNSLWKEGVSKPKNMCKNSTTYQLGYWIFAKVHISYWITLHIILLNHIRKRQGKKELLNRDYARICHITTKYGFGCSLCTTT